MAKSEETKSEWRRLKPGETVEVKQQVKCRDGIGKVLEVVGPNVLIALENGYKARVGIDGLLVEGD